MMMSDYRGLQGACGSPPALWLAICLFSWQFFR
jgi:hypothetical protein